MDTDEDYTYLMASGTPTTPGKHRPALDPLVGRTDSVETKHETTSLGYAHGFPSAERFLRLEGRLDELQEQVASTQQMIRDLGQLIEQQQRMYKAKTNLHSLTAQVLKNQLHLAARGPSTAEILPFLGSQSVSTNPTSTDTGDAVVVPSADELRSFDGHECTINEETAQLADQDLARLPPAMATSSRTHASVKRPSASNPIYMHTETKKKHSLSQAATHAASFVTDLARTASRKRVSIPKPKPESLVASASVTPSHDSNQVMTRKFSISSLDLNKPVHNSSFSFISRWSRTLFKRRVEPAVSPQEIMDARAGDKVHRFTIRHDTFKRSVWEVVVLIVILADVTVTPLSLSFQYTARGVVLFNYIGGIIFFCDFCINMLSSYTSERGELISGPSATIRHYFLSTMALPDLLSWFPFEYIVASDQGRFLGIAKVIRLAKVSQLARRFNSSKKAGFFRFINLLGTILTVSHCLACYWNWIAVEWRAHEGAYNEMPLSMRYGHCWAVMIGTMNASPPRMYTMVEEVSVATIMLIGNLLQATVFGSVAVLISSFDEEEVAYNKKLISTYERCKFLDIPEPLSRRIQGYYENLYREMRSVSTDADSFINELSPALICEVKFQLYRDMITQIPFLSASHINPVVIEMLILHLRVVIYMQDDVLMRKGEFGDWMGFIGSKGSVGVLDPNTDASQTRKIIRILRKGDYFGEMALLHRATRSTTAIALAWVQIHVLCRNDLDDVKEQYPEQAEILEEEIRKYMKSKVTYK